MDLPTQASLYEPLPPTAAGDSGATGTASASSTSVASGKTAAAMLSTGAARTDTANNAVTAGRRLDAVIDSKLKGKSAHLENPVKDAVKRQEEKEARDRRRMGRVGSAKRKKTLSRKERVALGDVGKPADKNISYKLFIPLHKLWKGYMNELFASELQDTSYSFASEQTLTKIVKADFHGAVITGILSVAQSKSTHYVGISGIMIKETENMFYIVTRDDIVKGVPKANSNFTFVFADKLFTLFGNHIKGSAADRVTKKFRAKPTVEL
ncbi:Rof/RNase P-like protein [Chytriomyces sp. MP71]|nr:Rof/RNase P-like protein [Chytriomyces sp. MP71]